MMNNPNMKSIAPYDISLTPERCVRAVRLWVNMLDPSSDPAAVAAQPIPPEILANPWLNPIAADYSFLRTRAEKTRLILGSGTWEILHPDVLRFVDKCEREGLGSQTAYVLGEKMIHCFPIGWDLAPEPRKALEIIVDLVRAGTE
jgi:hypothetical protein